jgi:hypothetical protein
MNQDLSRKDINTSGGMNNFPPNYRMIQEYDDAKKRDNPPINGCAMDAASLENSHLNLKEFKNRVVFSVKSYLNSQGIDDRTINDFANRFTYYAAIAAEDFMYEGDPWLGSFDTYAGLKGEQVKQYKLFIDYFGENPNIESNLQRLLYA